ncbi:hypothetical protein IV498_07600 [Paenarthrobacter sp. Z7-10]|uniref:hypothetical protein n=1 Tax=Paenarthrobacter sp. Z7-10 TaxID=2787635 RepID=UPI0022A98FDA|nr:hypothetical protein [Paenarthrobacter sp. Z7-10]MCZ2403050.1 hypothetical protein [Paenarthrobacter sp. Z7-10]
MSSTNEPAGARRDDSGARREDTDTSRIHRAEHRGAAREADADREAAGREMRSREKESYGGVKVGSAFFGWLTATGMAVLLTALVAAAGTAVGVATNTNATKALNQVSADPQTVGVAGSIILLVILFVAYYCGGYVAGRMARFNGIRQGVMVWIWAIIIAVLVAILAAIAGSKFNILANLNSFPRIPINEGTVTTAGIIAVVVVAAASLLGAILGGLAGMHFHRKVDRAGLTTATGSDADAGNGR